MDLGQNNQAGKSLLKTEYSNENDISKNLKLAVKILLKTMDSVTPGPDRIELSFLKLMPDGSVVHTLVKESEISVLIEEIQKEESSEQKKATAPSGDI
jgi:hypothetical protein